MKPLKFYKNLKLNKKTIADLNNREMGNVQGGGPSGLSCPICPVTHVDDTCMISRCPYEPC